MEKIKFISSMKQQQLFAADVRKNVNDYFKKNGISTKGNLYLVIQTLVMFFIYVTPFIILLLVPMNIWFAIMLSVLIGIGMAGIGMCVMHDAAHGSYSHKEWVNKILCGTMYILGSNVYNWKIQHNILHHVYTNIDGFDRDIESRGPLRFSFHSRPSKINHFQHIHAFFFYGLMTITKLFNDFTQLMDFKKAGITRENFNLKKEFIKMAIVKTLYLFVLVGLPILFSRFSWWQVLLGFFIMHWIAGCILSIFFQMAHMVEGIAQPLPNSKIIECDWAVHELITTADFARNNLLLNWYIGGLNFQIEHHLFSNISHVHYRKIAPIVEKTAKQYGFYYNLKPTFFNALFSHIRTLKELGKQSSKSYVPG